MDRHGGRSAGGEENRRDVCDTGGSPIGIRVGRGDRVVAGQASQPSAGRAPARVTQDDAEVPRASSARSRSGDPRRACRRLRDRPTMPARAAAAATRRRRGHGIGASLADRCGVVIGDVDRSGHRARAGADDRLDEILDVDPADVRAAVADDPIRARLDPAAEPASGAAGSRRRAGSRHPRAVPTRRSRARARRRSRAPAARIHRPMLLQPADRRRSTTRTRGDRGAASARATARSRDAARGPGGAQQTMIAPAEATGFPASGSDRSSTRGFPPTAAAVVAAASAVRRVRMTSSPCATSRRTSALPV